MFLDLPKGTLVKFKSWDGYFKVGVIEEIVDGRYKIHLKDNKVSTLFIEPSDVIQIVDKDAFLNFTPKEEEVVIIEEPAKFEDGDLVEEPAKVEIEKKKGSFYGMFENGGTAFEVLTLDSMPNELTIYIPLFDSNGNPSSDEEIEHRTSDVKEYLEQYFGEYIVKNMASSYVNENGEMIMQKHIQISAYPTDAEFNDFKHILINQISVWAKEWNQSFINFEYEDKTFSIMPTEKMMKKGGELWIQDAISKMKKKGTLDSFTKQAKREGLTPIEFAKKVINKPKGYTLKTRRRAMFVKNTNPEKF